MPATDKGAVALSVIVVVHDMAREAPRTLHSLSADYQRGIAADEYEVIVVDNGSTPPVDPALVESLHGDFRLIRMEPAPPSPAKAINAGLAVARGEVIGVMIDGARMVTPGLLHYARCGARLHPGAVVVTLGWYLGLDQQRWAIEGGYDQPREDALLASIDWPSDGYRLFEIGALDESSVDGWFGPLNESNGLFLGRESWAKLGGFDEQFDAPGGGFANLDVLARSSALDGAELVVLLGEATFHQLHGGVATNAPPHAIAEAVSGWSAQYAALRGHPWGAPTWSRRTYLGELPPAYLKHFARATLEPLGDSPLGAQFDPALWALTPTPRPADGQIAALVDLARTEMRARRFAAAAAVARMARKRAPDEPAPQQLASVAGPWLRGPGAPPAGSEAGFHRARGDASRILGDPETAAAEYRKALTFDADLVEAHVGLSELRLPGDSYPNWLDRLHEALRPRTYLEIGVARGQTLALARPPTRAIGIDPAPQISFPFRTETHVYCETSDAFFARPDLRAIVGDGPLEFAFIDGLHHFQQALRDFINVEALCGPRSVVAMHDTYPLDELTQRPERQRRFYSGDIWKTILCLRALRPDLQIATIATPWTGLTVVTGLDPTSRVLSDRFDQAVAQTAEVRYEDMEGRLPDLLGLIPNEWSRLAEQLDRRPR